jgi:phosphopantothenoylcysteine decarboxylase/phosphopantothenate--cysteine ligase
VQGRRVGQLIVGFAAETADSAAEAVELGLAKLARKGCDLLVLNAVGDGKAFGQSDNAGMILGSDGTHTEIELGPKAVLASAVWDAVLARLAG